MPLSPNISPGGRAIRTSIFAVWLFTFGATAALATSAEEAAGLIETSGVTGGLVVHVGCGDGRLTAALRAGEAFLVHGLDSEQDNVARAREHVTRLGLYGEVAVEQWNAGRLPYADNIVNLLVVENRGIPTTEECLRVLAPGGVVCVRSAGQWTKTVKPRPDELDEWTHFLYDAANNAVSHDSVVAPPKSLQWIGGPRFARSHEHLASISAVVASAGRIFYIVDEGPIESVAFPTDWALVARDAFSGVVLWKQPMGQWEPQLREFRSGPPQLPRRLVAVGDRVYVTPGYGEPVVALDAASGETVTTYKNTDRTEEIVFVDGLLLLAVECAAAESPEPEAAARRRGLPALLPQKRVLAVEADSGKIVWETPVEGLAPVTLGAAQGRAFYQAGAQAFALDLKTGDTLWQSEPLAKRVSPAAWYSPALTAYGNVLLWADGRMLTGLSAETGKTLWQSKSALNWHAPPDVLVAGGLVWTGQLRIHREPGITEGLDPLTGQVKRTRPADQETFQPGMTHHRCYRNKATERYLLLGRAGTEYLDVETGEIVPNHWVRGTCQYGVMPANGLLYAPPHACACFLTAKLNGFLALAPERDEGRGARDASKETSRLTQGPAYNTLIPNPQSLIPSPLDWPTYRHDPARSGAASTNIPAKLVRAWESDVGGKLSAVTVALDRCFLASADTHTVYALDVETGKQLWAFTAGGRVDTPPTITGGLAVFGSADGCVYCLSAADGSLVWRFQAAPEQRRIVVRGQLESAWPVHGSVMVEGDVASFAAGRSSFVDGGIRLFRVDLASGKKLTESTVYTPDAETGEQPLVDGFDMQGALPDVLGSDGTTVFMRQLCFDPTSLQPVAAKPHLFSPTGLVDDTWWHRTYWLYGSTFTSGWPGWWKTGNQVPAGRILAFDDKTIYGFGRSVFKNWPRNDGANWASVEPYHLFAASKQAAQAASPDAGVAKRKRGEEGSRFTWSVDSPVRARAMLLAGETILIAGPPNLGNHDEDALAAYQGRKGASLCTVAAADGTILGRQSLPAPPVFDGMSAAGGRVFVALEDGRLMCMAESK